jgi:hypothetical protein
MNPSRYPILTFTLVGAILAFTNDALIRGLMTMAQSVHGRRAMVLAEVVSWLGPGIWLAVIAFCLVLTTGSVTPPWARGRWLIAAGAFYLFHIPLIAFPPLAIFGRWGISVYLFLGTVGIVCAIWLLMGRFHVAGLLILAEPIVSIASRGYLPRGMRSAAMTIFAIVGFPLIGWWVRDTAARHKQPPAAAISSSEVTIALDGGF